MQRWKSDHTIERVSFIWPDSPKIDVMGVFGDSGELSLEDFTTRMLAQGASREDVFVVMFDAPYHIDLADAMYIAGREVLYANQWGEYHGVSAVVYHYEGTYHVYVHEYGSCPGCDTFIKLLSDADLNGIMDMVDGAVGHTGKTLASAIDAAKSMGWASAWSYGDEESAAILAWLDTLPLQDEGE